MDTPFAYRLYPMMNDPAAQTEIPLVQNGVLARRHRPLGGVESVSYTHLDVYKRQGADHLYGMTMQEGGQGIVIQKAGVYLLSYGVSTSSQKIGEAAIMLSVGGTALMPSKRTVPQGGASIACQTILPLYQGDVLELCIQANEPLLLADQGVSAYCAIALLGPIA